jgi:hypothetical protein
MMTARLVPDLPEHEYHRDPALSSSGARAILRSPARFAYDREHGRADTTAFDEGHAAHALVLGVGAPLFTPCDPQTGEPYAEWRSADAKRQVAEARAAGCTPLKADQAATVTAMAARLREHPEAGRLLAAGSGRPEVSGFWTDNATGVACRVRFDWLHWTGRGWVAVDYKTSPDASPDAFARSAAKYGYHQQDPWYRDGAAALGLGEVPFVFVVQEKDPPYLVGCYELDDEALAAGWRRNRAALDLFATCAASGVWPGYADHITTLSLPRWAVRDYTGEDY